MRKVGSESSAISGTPLSGDPERTDISEAKVFTTRRRLLIWALLGSCVVVVFVLSPVRNAWGDTALTIPTTRSLLTTGDLSLSEFEGSPLLNHYAIAIVDGKPVNFFPWTVSLFAIPAVLAKDLLYKIGFGESSYQAVMNANTWGVENVAASLTVGLAVAVAGELIHARLRAHSPRRRLVWSILGASTFAFGTSAWSVASRSLWQHAPSLLLVVAALLVATHLGRSQGIDQRAVMMASGLGALLALAYTARPTNAVGLFLFAVWVAWRSRRLLAAYVAGALTVLGVWATVNTVNGLGAVPSYSNTGRLSFHEHFVEALAGNLISPARGLFVFSPILLLSLVGIWDSVEHRSEDRLELLAIPAFLGLWVGISMFPHWWGGHSFGPRLMTDTIPYLMVLAIPVIGRIDEMLCKRKANNRRVFLSPGFGIVLVLAGWSVFSHAQGAWMFEPACWNRVPEDIDLQPSRLWSWSDAQVTSGFRYIVGETPRTGQKSRCM